MRRRGGSRVAGIEADELRAHRVFGNGGHDAEVSFPFLDREHLANRLQDPPERKCGKGCFHCRDELVPFQQLPNALLAQV